MTPPNPTDFGLDVVVATAVALINQVSPIILVIIGMSVGAVVLSLIFQALRDSPL